MWASEGPSVSLSSTLVVFFSTEWIALQVKTAANTAPPLASWPSRKPSSRIAGGASLRPLSSCSLRPYCAWTARIYRCRYVTANPSAATTTLLLHLQLLPLLMLLSLPNPVLQPMQRKGQGPPTKPKQTPKDEAVNQTSQRNVEDERCNAKDKSQLKWANVEDKAADQRGQRRGRGCQLKGSAQSRG